MVSSIIGFVNWELVSSMQKLTSWWDRLVSHSENWFRQCRKKFKFRELVFWWKKLIRSKLKTEWFKMVLNRNTVWWCQLNSVSLSVWSKSHLRRSKRLEAAPHVCPPLFRFRALQTFQSRNQFLHWRNQFSVHETNCYIREANFQITNPISAWRN